MEPDEIGVVLARASELHAKISDAIERALKAEFMMSSGGRSPNSGELENAALVFSPGAVPEGPGMAEGGGKSADRKYEGDAYEKGAVVGDGSAEARSLGAIRDALETLEEQLESLQAVQQQQRAEKDRALAELEESRRILLSRLKEHRGREWEVVHEALAFAGEPVEDRDDLPLPPYPMPVADSFPAAGENQAPPYKMQVRTSGQMRRLSIGPGVRESIDDLNFKVLAGDESEDELLEELEEEGTPRSEQSRMSGRGFFASMFGHAFGLTTKAALVVVSVLAALAVSEVSHRLEKKRAGNGVSHQNPPSPAQVRQNSPPAVVRECPPGKKLIIEDGFPKCVVKERVELPFPREIKNPDVLYGRG